MKYLLLIIVLFSINSFAGFVAESKINQCDRIDYTSPSTCQESESESCYQVPNDSGECGIFKLQDILIDDLSNPIWGSRSMVEPCIDENDCKARHEAKVCTDGRSSFYSIDDLEVWCNKIVGYQKIVTGKEMVVDQTLKFQKDAEKAVAQAIANARSQVKALRECLAGVIDLLIIRNSTKNLTVEQVDQMVQTYQPIMALLQAVSGVTAKEKIQEVSADGVLVTENDKIALTQEIDKCLGN